MVLSVVSIILVSIMFFLRPDESMLLVMVKDCLIWQNILFYISFRSLLNNIRTKLTKCFRARQAYATMVMLIYCLFNEV